MNKKSLYRFIKLTLASLTLAVSCGTFPKSPDVSGPAIPPQQETKNDILTSKDFSPAAVAVNISPEYFGMSQAEVLNIEGAAGEKAVYDGGKVVHLLYFSKGLTFCFTKETLTSVIYYSGIAGGYETGRFAYNTRPVALPVNNSLRFPNVVSLLGQPSEQVPFPYAPIPSFKAAYPSRGLTFEFITSTQQMISMEIYPAR